MHRRAYTCNMIICQTIPGNVRGVKRGVSRPDSSRMQIVYEHSLKFDAGKSPAAARRASRVYDRFVSCDCDKNSLRLATSSVSLSHPTPALIYPSFAMELSCELRVAFSGRLEIFQCASGYGYCARIISSYTLETSTAKCNFRGTMRGETVQTVESNCGC